MASSPVVTLNAENWKAISNLIGEHCKSLPKDWQKWGNEIQERLQTAIHEASQNHSAEKVDIELNEKNWRLIMDVINKACQKKGKEWVSWSNKTCQKIKQTLGDSKTESSTKPPPEAWEHYNQAEKIKYKEGDSKSLLNEKAAEYALAIKKANGFFPAAHAQLGATFLMAGFEDRARQELNTAIQQENCNTAARFYLIMMDIDKLGMPKVPKNTGSFVIDMLSLGGGFAVAQGKVNSLSNKIDEFVRAFHDDVNDTDEIEYWLSRSEMMIMLHDEIQGIKLMPRKDRLVQAVINARWKKIVVPPEFEQKVNDVKRRAEGRALLAK